MKTSVCVLALSTLAGLSGLAVAQTTPRSEPQPVIRSTTSEVLLDLVVRDKRGKPVKNLKVSDLEIYEDGARQEIKSFRFVGTRESQKLKSGNVTVRGEETVRPLRSVNAFCVVFHNLDPVSRRRAIEAVEEFLKGDWPQETYFGIFNLDDHLTPIYPFSNKRDELIQAAHNAFSLSPVDFAQASQAILTANPNQVTIVTTVDIAARTSESVMRVTGGEISRSLVTGADVDTGAGANALRGNQVTERRDMSNVTGMRETDKINTMISQLGQLPGRKSILLVSTGLVTTGDPDIFQAMLNRANQAGITVYGFDIAGLDEVSTAQGANVALGQVASVSRGQTSIASGTTTNGGGTSESLSVAKERSRQGDTLHDAVRSSDSQAALRALAEGTGGFLIANTNDFRKPFQHIVEDSEAHYEALYRPTADRYDGRLRKIEVKMARADLRVESRTGYFALPDLKGATPLQPYEMAALAVLSAKPLPHAFDFRAGTFGFRSDGTNLQRTLVFEVPGTSLVATARPDRLTHLVHTSLMAVVKDSTGQIVDRFSLDAPYEIPDANFPAVRASAAMYSHPVSLPAGHYTVETAVLDREGKRASTSVFEFENPQPQKTVGLSSVLLLQRVEPVTGQPDPADPLVFKGRRLAPMLTTTLNADAKPIAYFVVYPDKTNTDKPKIRVEFLSEGKVMADQTTDLPAPDASGAISMMVHAATHPGSCELRITALQGSESASQSVKYTIAPKS